MFKASNPRLLLQLVEEEEARAQIPFVAALACHAVNETPTLDGLAELADGSYAAGAKLCGASPIGSRVEVEVLNEWTPPAVVRRLEAAWVGAGGAGGAGGTSTFDSTSTAAASARGSRFGHLTLLANNSLPPDLLSVPGHAFNCSHRPKEDCTKRISLTANPVRISRRLPSGQLCEVFVGIGHVHRGDGPMNRWTQRRDREEAREASRREAKQAERRGRRKRRQVRRRESNRRRLRWMQPLQFGYNYTHLFYTFSLQPPHRLLATSEEFCVAAPGSGGARCESIQFLSGLAAEPVAEQPDTAEFAPARLLLSYGVNDCEARVGKLEARRLWARLRPLPGVANSCSE